GGLNLFINSIGASNFQSVILPAFYTKLVDAIRSVDPYHICIWEERTTVPLNRPETVYSVHYPALGDDWTYDLNELPNIIQSDIQLAQSWNVPLYIGEWGQYYNSSQVQQYITESLSLYDRYPEISSTWFTYGPLAFETALVGLNGDLRPNLIGSLVRPYVRTSTVENIMSTYDPATRILKIEASPSASILVSVPGSYVVKSLSPNSATVTNQTYAMKLTPVTDATITFQYSSTALSELGPFEVNLIMLLVVLLLGIFRRHHEFRKHRTRSSFNAMSTISLLLGERSKTGNSLAF
ncbi:MAG TPA: cellulase family glycosylhydrolase, partial [Candidatus Bathyarchaeia archaeon]|nr:cellulase family glycosylhydrolase [Candidatus Bathyarchaeia archaeon]